MAVMSSPAILPAHSVLTLSLQTLELGPEGGLDSVALRQCFVKSSQQYRESVASCRAELNGQLLKCSSSRDLFRDYSCASEAYSSYRKCAAWASQVNQWNQQSCFEGGRDWD